MAEASSSCRFGSGPQGLFLSRARDAALYRGFLMQLREALRTAVTILNAHDIAAPGLAAELLLMHVLGRDRAYLYTYPETELTPETGERYFEFVGERARGKPTQYITGHQEFWGLDFEVTPDVLIPRPETEHLVEVVLELAPRRTSKRAGTPPAAVHIVDVGTGSGCIALALASELTHSVLYATDLSRAALGVARRNARRLRLDDRICFIETDLLAGLTTPGCAGRFDFVVSNPPYVGGDQTGFVQREVREFEPRLAWGGTGAGHEIYHRLFAEAHDALCTGGYVVVEVGYNQSDVVAGMLQEGWTGTEVRPDLAGIPRVVLARKKDSTEIREQNGVAASP